jgi:hypothetical protein
MQIEGITWHASVVDEASFDSMRTLTIETLGLSPMMEFPGVAVFAMPNGSIFELYEQGSEMVPPYGYNEGGIAFGFRVDDIEAASEQLEAAGAEILGDIQRADMGGTPYAYRHFRGTDGNVYGLNQLG